MENEKLICKTNAEVLLHYEPLKDNGFVFHYANKWLGRFQHFVNCNGEIFGPFCEVAYISVKKGKASWTAFQSKLTLEYSENGKECLSIHKNAKEYTDERWHKAVNEWQSFLKEIHSNQEKCSTEGPEEIYHEDTHVLEYPHKKQEFFVTEKKKYGPYLQIYRAFYLDKEHFQFSYVKDMTSDFFYNYNGKEYKLPCHDDCYSVSYSSQNKAIVGPLQNQNYIYINGEKIECFSKNYTDCCFTDYNGQEIITGIDSKKRMHIKINGKELRGSAYKAFHLQNGAVVYSQIKKNTETWFYNEKQISLPVKGYDSDLYGSIISYVRDESKNLRKVPFCMINGTEYSCIRLAKPEKAFVYLKDGGLYYWQFDYLDCEYGRNDDYYDEIRENFIRLSQSDKMAGE